VTLPAEALTIDADPTRMAQVISNLLNNSARYTDRGGSIELVAERRGGEVVLRVRDNGMGIPEADLHRVFEIFTQLERPAGSPGGLGIGLSIVRQLVAMHGGSVSAHSAGPGEGERIQGRPAARGACARSTYERLAEVSTARTESAHPVADDNADAASSMGMMLEMLGHEARIAHDGEEALAAGREFLPQLVMLDLGMPRLDGYECCRRCAKSLGVPQSRWWRSPAGARTRISAEPAAGFDAHLVKPVSLENLERVIADAAKRCGLAAAPERSPSVDACSTAPSLSTGISVLLAVADLQSAARMLHSPAGPCPSRFAGWTRGWRRAPRAPHPQQRPGAPWIAGPREAAAGRARRIPESRHRSNARRPRRVLRRSRATA
jgi:CheY-like chemotaxis protein